MLRIGSLSPFVALLPLAAVCVLGAAPPRAAVKPTISFRNEIEPILKAECSGCHGKDAQSGGFSIETPALLKKGGKRFGAQIVVPGQPERSALLGYLTGKHQPQMPVGRPALDAKTIARVRAWIAEGALIDVETLGWPYQPPAARPLPRVKNPVLATEWVRNPIDSFVLAKLESQDLLPSPPADKRTLLRRVTFDLVGVPPTPEEADAFVADTSEDAYEKVVDRLLADPRYGERWARHWLDLVRYAETHGFEADNIRPHAWRFRDYVIRSFNADKPYDRFLKEQIAGDELYPQSADAWIATGFARLGAWDELTTDGKGRWQDALNDATDTLGSAMLGMTVGCARCHDHKYDRIGIRDYYRLQAFFGNARWTDSKLPEEIDPPALVARRDAARNARDAAEKELEAIRTEARAALGNPKADDETIGRWLDDPARKETRRRWEETDRRRDRAARELTPIEPVAEAFTDTKAEVPTHPLLLRGNLATPGETLQPGFIASLCGAGPADAVIQKPAKGSGSGARSALAEWVASPTNPLTARVIANRLWQHHLGVGIVRTPSDFGRNGAKPSHPELLDWLALELVKDHWSLKKLHRLMVTSATYRQGIGADPLARRKDPENLLLWRQNRQRLEGEAIRDSILAVSGQLNGEAGGPSVYPAVSDEVLATGSTHKWGSSPEDQQRRRTVYVFQRRSLALPLTEVFDGPDMVNTCPRRAATTIAPQALALFNGAFSHEQAERFAQRVARDAGSDLDARIARAYRLAFTRRPTAPQLAAARAYVEAKVALHAREGSKDPSGAALTDLCHVLFNTNEFLYVD